MITAILWIATALSMPTVPQLGFNRGKALIVAVLVASAVQSLIVGMHLRGLARRVPNDSLGAHLFNSAVLFAVSCLLMLGFNGLAFSDAPTPVFLFCVPAGGIIAAIVAWTVWTLVRMSLEFRHCAVAGQTILDRQAMRAAAANAPRPERAG
jgi:hypothetical protein